MPDPSELVRPLVRVRQIRAFTDEPPSDDQLDAIHAARWAGSSGNSQPCRFVLIKDIATIRALGEAGLSQTRPLLTAPVAIAVVLPADDHEVSRAYDEGRAVERIMTAAELVGLRSGITWIRRDVAPVVAAALALPEGVLVRTIMAIGHPTDAALAPKAEPGKARLPRDEVVMHERWRSTEQFAPVIEVARALRGYPRPWFVSGGWAIDLFVGRVTREHEDIEVGAYHPHQERLRAHLSGWELFRIRGDAWEPWRSDDTIELPEFQVQARSTRRRPPVFDLFLNPLEGDEWVSRRHAGLRVPTALVCARTAVGGVVPGEVPYLAAEIQLLYKAKYHRPKDDADFAVAIQYLSGGQRAWLREALVAHHPGDPWIARL